MRDVVNAGAVDLVEATVAAGATPTAARKWWSGEVARRANAAGRSLDEMGVSPQAVAELDALVRSGRLTDAMARQVFDGVLDGEGTPTQVADARGLAVVSDDSALSDAVDSVVAANPDIAEKVRDGKIQAVGALIGQVMKAMGGQADAAKVRQLLLDRLTD